MLSELARLCDRERLIGDPAFEIRPVAWIIHLNADGTQADFIGTHYTPAAPDTGGKKKTKPKEQLRKLLIPRQFKPETGATRTGDDYAYFLVDKADYVLGFDSATPLGQPQTDKKLRHRQQLFIDKIAACHAATGEPTLAAVLSFLRQVAAHGLPANAPAKLKSNDLFAFRVDPELELRADELPAVRTYWRSICLPLPSANSRWHCLIDGTPIEKPALIPQIKNIKPGGAATTALISFNKSAFESYGWDSSENAPISSLAAQKATTALNRLLSPAFEVSDGRPPLPVRHERIGLDTAICYWPAAQPDSPSYAFANLWTALKNVTDTPDAGQVGELVHALWRGIAPARVAEEKFYAVTLTGAQGRAMVRDWFETTVGRLQHSIATYFEQLALCRNTHPAEGRPHPPAHSYLSLVGNLYKNPTQTFAKLDDIPSRTAIAYHRSYLDADIPFPGHLLALSLDRVKARIGDASWIAAHERDAQLALIKAILIRNHDQTRLKPTLDMNTPPEPAYRLGQLFACIERMQGLALGKETNSTVANRYFSAAATTPRTVFPRLITLYNQHYVKKARREQRRAMGRVVVADQEFHRLMHDITTDFGFPPKLTLKDQGLFMIGFHHQRHRFWFGTGEDTTPEPIATESTQAS